MDVDNLELSLILMPTLDVSVTPKLLLTEHQKLMCQTGLWKYDSGVTGQQVP